MGNLAYTFNQQQVCVQWIQEIKKTKGAEDKTEHFFLFFWLILVKWYSEQLKVKSVMNCMWAFVILALCELQMDYLINLYKVY